MQCVLSIIQFSEADLLSVYVLEDMVLCNFLGDKRREMRTKILELWLSEKNALMKLMHRG